jgi:hypothetical protein
MIFWGLRENEISVFTGTKSKFINDCMFEDLVRDSIITLSNFSKKGIKDLLN